MQRKVGVVGCVASSPGIIFQKVGNHDNDIHHSRGLIVLLASTCHTS